MIAVAAAIIFHKEKVLVARRAAGKHLAGYWEFPGGKIEPGETPEDCLIREIAEELGINIKVKTFLAEHLHDYGDKLVLLKGYRCLYISGSIALIDHDATEWVSIESLGNYMLAPADIPLAAALNRL